MATKREKSPFDALKYEKPKGDPATVARAFVDQVSEIPEVVEVWGHVDGMTLYLETFFEGSLDDQLKVIDCEIQVRDANPDTRVEYRIWHFKAGEHWTPSDSVLL